jgi:serine/threonine protein phosphatase PrpC
MYTNKGGREKNEDRLDSFVNESNAVFVLADGLGGHKNGEKASEAAVTSLLDIMKKAEKIDADYLCKAFLDANAEILEKQNEPQCRNMKTTAVVLHICGNKAVWGHIGDSRLYHFSGWDLLSITKDHSVTYKKYISGDISYVDIRTDEDRSSLLNVMGNPIKCAPEIAKPMTVKPGDAFLLCTDGFWEYVYDEEMLIDLLKSDTPREWADYMLLRHIQRTKPFNDNLSFIALMAIERTVGYGKTKKL